MPEIKPSAPAKPSVPSSNATPQNSLNSQNSQEGSSELPEKKGRGAQGSESDESPESGEEDAGAGNLFSPEALLIMPIAAVLDIVALVLLVVPPVSVVVSYVLDFAGFILIGGWMFVRSAIGIGNLDQLKAAAKKGVKRFVVALCVELVPLLGDVCPSWLWLVYKTLKAG